MNNYKVVPTTWIDQLQFVGTATRTVKMRVPNREYYREEEETAACYGWSKGGKFVVYLVESGHISRIGTMSSDSLTPPSR